MKGMGIRVHTLREMEMLMEQHPELFGGAQAMMKIPKPFSEEKPYYNKRKATRSQRDDIISQVIKNKYQTSGTDIIKIGRTLFLVDHTTAEDLYTNFMINGKIPDGRGYGIRNKFNFAKLNEVDLHEIIRNIASDYQGSEELIQHRLQEFGITSEQLPGIDITSAI